ncbi:MAG: hypothetical protein QOF56_3566 [Acidobacteriaceae bacterium]|nr:hypothetical protein [Acidobacteriaceae bacterium]
METAADFFNKRVARVLNGKAGISTAVAIRLAAALGTTPELGMNMQSRYDLWRARPAMSIKLDENRARYYLPAPVRNSCIWLCAPVPVPLPWPV